MYMYMKANTNSQCDTWYDIQVQRSKSLVGNGQPNSTVIVKLLYHHVDDHLNYFAPFLASQYLKPYFPYCMCRVCVNGLVTRLLFICKY